MKQGDRIGDFTIVNRLKRGGMATVYLAQRKGAGGFSKHVVIKVVHPHLAKDEYFVKMFLDEARLSARINHPNCVHVEQLGEVEGSYFLVMEFVHGCTLSTFHKALLKKGRRLTPEIAVFIAAAIAEGLHGAHETRDPSGKLLGVVHRDVSPDNIMLAYQGHIKLIDFGIAKAAGRIAETVAKTIKGKFRYMSPEHATGKEVDRRSDIYSAGILLWEMLTGRRLFDAPDQWILLNLVREPKVEPPSQFADGISPELDAAVLAALAKDPQDRPQTAAELRKMLLQAVPLAALVETTELSELVRFVMADRIEQDKKLLPQELEQSITHEVTLALTDSDLLGTFTVSDQEVSSTGSATPSADLDEGVEVSASDQHPTGWRARAKLLAQRAEDGLRRVGLGTPQRALVALAVLAIAAGAAFAIVPSDDADPDGVPAASAPPTTGRATGGDPPADSDEHQATTAVPDDTAEASDSDPANDGAGETTALATRTGVANAGGVVRGGERTADREPSERESVARRETETAETETRDAGVEDPAVTQVRRVRRVRRVTQQTTETTNESGRTPTGRRGAVFVDDIF